MRHIIKATIAAISFLLAACGSENASNDATSEVTAITPVSWRMTSTFPSSMPILGTLGIEIAKNVEAISGGTVKLNFVEPGVLVPALEIFDAVSYGAIEAGWSTSGYWGGKISALQLFTAVPFGPSAPEYISWYDYGGGKEIYERIYAEHNIHGVICGVTPPEAGGWFKEEIKTLEDFKGKKIRFFGLGGKVLEKVGASPQLIAGGEIYQALELGTIDGTEYAMPVVDLNLGFYEVAKHYYLPGWHQQTSFFELLINEKAWNSLHITQQVQIEAACSHNIRVGLGLGESLQTDAIATLKEKGAIIHRWSPEILAGLKGAWLEVAKEQSDMDPNFAEAWHSLSAFRKKYRVWSELGYLKD